MRGLGIIASSRGGFDPQTAIPWHSVMWAEDPLMGTHYTDGASVYQVPNNGSIYSTLSSYTDPTDGLVMRGASGLGTQGAYVDGASAPDVTTELEVQMLIKSNGAISTGHRWSGQYNGATTTRWLLYTSGGGVWRLYLSNGAAITSVNFVTNTTLVTTETYVKVTWRNSDGRAQLFTSSDGVSWAQQGGDQTIYSGVTLPSITATPFTIGAGNAGAEPVNGNIYWCQVRDSIGGSVIFEADFRRAKTMNFTPATGANVTILDPISPKQITAANQPLFRTNGINSLPAIDFITNDFLYGLFTAITGQTWSLVAVVDMDSNTTGTVVGWNNLNNNRRLAYSQTTPSYQFRGNVGTIANSGATDQNQHLLVAKVTNVGTLTTELIVDNGATNSGDLVADTAAITSLCLGASGSGASGFLDGRIAFVGLYLGDVEADGEWPNFLSWVARYGMTIAP